MRTASSEQVRQPIYRDATEEWRPLRAASSGRSRRRWARCSTLIPRRPRPSRNGSRNNRHGICHRLPLTSAPPLLSQCRHIQRMGAFDERPRSAQLSSGCSLRPLWRPRRCAQPTQPQTTGHRRRPGPMRPTSPRRRRRSSRRRTATARPDRDHHHRDQARGESAERPDQRPGDRHAAARPAEHLELRGLHQAAAVGDLPDGPAGRHHRLHARRSRRGGDGNHSGSLPSVGTYLDEQPVTTIGGTLDVHIYDIARIESLAGPQGTLYGASSEAGTIRIITNKPELGVTTRPDRRRDQQGRSRRHGRQARGHDQPADRPTASRSAASPSTSTTPATSTMSSAAGPIAATDLWPSRRCGRSRMRPQRLTSTMPASKRRISTTSTSMAAGRRSRSTSTTIGP